jgi:tRNA nucleotidyltransferase/poly(A) polymerase
MDSKTCKKNIRESHLQIMKEVGQAADKSGETCLVVGGFVRDCLTNKRSDDLDFVCTDIDKIAHELEKKGVAKNITSERGITGENYRTNIVIFGKEKVDLVEPRKEIYTKDSIKPIVEKGDFEDDAIRRDFTINTLQLGVSKNDWMQIYDPTGKGMQDLDEKILRTPRKPELTFDEDPTRMLRAVRFSVCHNLSLLPNVTKAIQNMSSEMKRVTPELIHKELMKGAKCNNYYRVMENVGLMKEIFPEVSQLKGIKQSPRHHTEDALEHTLRTVEYIPSDPIFRTAALLHDIGKYETTDAEGHAYEHEKISVKKVSEIGKRLKFSHEDIKRMEDLVGNHMRLHNFDLEKITEKGVRRFIRDYDHIYPELQVMTRADIKSDSKHPLESLQELDTKIVFIDSHREKMRELLDNQFKIEINGNDIKKLGWEGKEIGAIKSKVENAVIEGTLPNERNVLLNYLLELKK